MIATKYVVLHAALVSAARVTKALVSFVDPGLAGRYGNVVTVDVHPGI